MSDLAGKLLLPVYLLLVGLLQTRQEFVQTPILKYQFQVGTGRFGNHKIITYHMLLLIAAMAMNAKKTKFEWLNCQLAKLHLGWTIKGDEVTVTAEDIRTAGICKPVPVCPDPNPLLPVPNGRWVVTGTSPYTNITFSIVKCDKGYVYQAMKWGSLICNLAKLHLGWTTDDEVPVTAEDIRTAGICVRQEDVCTNPNWVAEIPDGGWVTGTFPGGKVIAEARCSLPPYPPPHPTEFDKIECIQVHPKVWTTIGGGRPINATEIRYAGICRPHEGWLRNNTFLSARQNLVPGGLTKQPKTESWQACSKLCSSSAYPHCYYWTWVKPSHPVEMYKGRCVPKLGIYDRWGIYSPGKFYISGTGGYGVTPVP